MKIAILGTKGIPNNYGGYEQFAEFISRKLVERGHEVTVYNPSFHPFKEDKFEGVTIIRKYSPEGIMGGAANFIYDYLCLKDALKKDFDIIYEAGYHSVAISYKLLNIKKIKHPVILTNMDGLEYKRSKWNALTRSLIRYLEAMTVRESHYLISDNEGIQHYYQSKFGADSYFIPYGADRVKNFDPGYLNPYSIDPRNYMILVARLEPENNIEMILDGHVLSGSLLKFLVVGNYMTSYGYKLKNKYSSSNIQFVGGVYNKAELDSLRYFAMAYFHGHSVGGTNPSLLEAMASKSFIAAHDNEFNRSVLLQGALYFKNEIEVSELIKTMHLLRQSNSMDFMERNLLRLDTYYDWDKIATQYEELFMKLLI